MQGAAFDLQELQRHRDEDQVQLDVDRSFVYYPRGTRVICQQRSHLTAVANALQANLMQT